MNTSRFSAFLILVALLAALPTVVQGQQGCSIGANDFTFEYKAGIEYTIPFSQSLTIVSTSTCYSAGDIVLLDLPSYFEYDSSTYAFSRQTIPADSIGSSFSLQYVVYSPGTVDNPTGVVQDTASIVLTNTNEPNTLSAVFDSLSWTENEGFNSFNQPISVLVTDDDYDPVVISDVEVLGDLASWIAYNGGASLTISRPGNVSTNFNGTLTDTLRVFAPDGEHADTPITLNINPIPDVNVAETLTVNFEEDQADSTEAIVLLPISNDYDTLNWTMDVPVELQGIVSMDASTGAIAFDPESSENLCGQWTFEANVEATNDNGSASDGFTVDLTIECVNDAPAWNHFEISACEGTLLTISFDVLDDWGWFVDDSDEGFEGNGVTPGIDWSTLSTSAIDLDFEGELVTFHWPENNSSQCCQSLETEWSFEVEDFNGEQVTGDLNATIEPFDSASVVTQVAMNQTIDDGDTTTITIAWEDVDSDEVLLDVTSQSAGLAVVPPANPIFNSSPIVLEIVVDSLVCGQQSVSFQLSSYCDNGCDCGAETPGTTTQNFTVTLKDEDNDGIPDHYPGEIVDLNSDSDSDNDGIPDKAEQQWPGDATLACNWTLVDSDGDGTPDFLDADSDNDNIPDAVEGGAFYDNGWLADADMDGDGVRNHLDLDSDGDDILDTLEWGVEGYQNSDAWDFPNDPDTTAAGTPLYDFLDTDSDNDALPDSLEDTNLNGQWEFPESNARHPDSDGDGTHDNEEEASIQALWLGPAATSYPRVDRDSDDDGLPDALERESLWNPYHPDTDEDCLLDGLEIGLVSSSVVFDQAGETFKRTSNSFELFCESCNLPTNRFDADAGSTVTNPGLADTDGDGYADGFEDVNLNGRVDGDPGSGPLGGTSAPCPTCFSDVPNCSDCTTGPHAGVVESDPTEDCSPNCLVGTGCDCDGNEDGSDAAQENFCTNLWQELCEATADVSLDAGQLDSLIWSLLVPNPDSCSYFTVNGASFEEAKSYLLYYNATNDNDALPAPMDSDAYPNACDNCNPGYHLGYKSGGDPCPACSYVGGTNLQTFNNQGDSDSDSIGNICDECDNDAGGIKGCTDWHACNYDPFAACDASPSLCTYTLPDLNPTALSVCADTDEFDLLEELYDDLDDSVPNWRGDQKFDLVIGNYQEQDVQATADLSISIPGVLESNEVSCGTFEVQLTLNTPNDFSAWEEYAGFVHDSLRLDVGEAPQYGRFNQTGSEAKTITFFLQIDPAPVPSGVSTSLCAGFVAEIQLDNPFEPLPCDAVGSYQWTDVPADWSISESTVAQPILNVPATFAADSTQNLQVDITVGTCTATASYAIEAAEQSSMTLTSADGFQAIVEADQAYEVDFCANTLDTLLFGVEAVGGNWQPGIVTTEVWTTTENESFFISGNESTYSIDLPNLPVDATSHSNTLTIYLQENPNCNADSVTVTFNRRAAPTIAWSEGDTLDICETAALDSISFHANSGATGFGWNHPSSGLTQEASGEENDQIWLPLDLDTLTYDDHAFAESLTLEIPAEASIFLGCAAARDTLTIRVFEAPSVPQGANEFFRNPICAPFSETINDTLTPVSGAIGSVWNGSQFGIDWNPSNFDGCSLTGNVFASTPFYEDSTRIEAYLKWNNNSTSAWRCANVYDTLVIRIGESPVAGSIDWNLFPGEVDSLINVGDATCNGTAINFSLMPTDLDEDLDDPSSEAAAVGYDWWVNTNEQMSGDRTFTYNVEDNATIEAAAVWTYTIDDVVFSCSSDTIPEDIAVASETACTSNPIIAYPGPAFLATALSNQDPVPDNYWVKWGYFSTDSDGTTVTGAHFFEDDPAQGAALFYPTQAQVNSVPNATNETLDQYIFALISFYGDDMKCPCLSVADGVVATGIEEWIDLEEVGFLVYPNPTTGRVFVEPPGGEPASEPLEARIYNMTGREVFRTGLASYGSQILDISHLQNGIYVLRITSPTEVRHLQTLILTQY